MFILTSENNACPDDETYRWAFCYLMGEAEMDNGTDIFYADKQLPDNGLHHAMLNGEPAIIKIEQDENIQIGLVALLSDIHSVGAITFRTVKHYMG